LYEEKKNSVKEVEKSLQKQISDLKDDNYRVKHQLKQAHHMLLDTTRRYGSPNRNITLNNSTQ
jgi:hypothetical protein